MKKEKVFIVVTQMRNLKTKAKDSWQVNERVEFVDQIRNKHLQTATAIGDYVNRKMVIGAAKGITEYDRFETYIREKYPKQMTELDAYFRPQPIVEEAPADDRPVTVDGDNIIVVAE